MRFVARRPASDSLGPDSTLGSGRPASRSIASRRWGLTGLVLGLLIGLVSFAPAHWLAAGLASATEGHVLLTDTRGSLWSGSGVLVLTGGTGSRDASALPGRMHWRAGLKGPGLRLLARQECCLNGEVEINLRPGLSRSELDVISRGDWLARLPASWLSGLGTPWNTLQLGGSLRISARDLRFEWVRGRLIHFGEAQLDLVNLSSRISTLAPLGSYRLSLKADTDNPGTTRLQLSTLEGGLQLSGQGMLSAGGKSRFSGEAAAAPGREEALNNLLNIIGRRQGPRSLLTIG